eukprot:TRINITY_DN4690_c0_g1_i1.p1 TRINITY_DN4690_c0_g1~~TRINITY_DN4690_c0_g1_i1.p1  ORF type:complete len:239 (-),score=31.20 TRINITY_DN4690_c0_g1_i1:241-957(-)
MSLNIISQSVDLCFLFNFGKYTAMGISRDSLHKRRATGGKQNKWRKKRKFNLGRQPGNTKLAIGSLTKDVRRIRVRGGHYKFRALRLDHGAFSWASEAITRKTRILDVVYNASSNELVRTKTLVKNAIIVIDANPFKLWYHQHYGITLGKKGEDVDQEADFKKELEGKSHSVQKKLQKRNTTRKIDPLVEDQFLTGRLYACIASRPGQSGRADGYILEGQELQFYLKKMQKKKGKAAA